MESCASLSHRKLQVSFAKEPYKRDYILQKRPIHVRLCICTHTNYVGLRCIRSHPIPYHYRSFSTKQPYDQCFFAEREVELMESCASLYLHAHKLRWIAMHTYTHRSQTSIHILTYPQVLSTATVSFIVSINASDAREGTT